MQEFDYSNETSNDLYDAVDGLSYEEAVFAKEAIEKIKEEKRIIIGMVSVSENFIIIKTDVHSIYPFNVKKM